MDETRFCSDYKDSLVLYIYGELGPAEAEQLKAHLAACAACRAEQESLARTIGAVRFYVPTRAETTRAVSGVMDRIGHTRRYFARKLAPAFVAAAVLASALVLTMQWMPFSFGEPPTGQVLMAKADLDTLENYEVVKDLDVLENLDTIDGMEEL